MGIFLYGGKFENNIRLLLQKRIMDSIPTIIFATCIFNHLHIQDVYNLMITSKTMHEYMNEEDIWKVLCKYLMIYMEIDKKKKQADVKWFKNATCPTFWTKGISSEITLRNTNSTITYDVVYKYSYRDEKETTITIKPRESAVVQIYDYYLFMFIPRANTVVGEYVPDVEYFETGYRKHNYDMIIHNFGTPTSENKIADLEMYDVMDRWKDSEMGVKSDDFRKSIKNKMRQYEIDGMISIDYIDNCFEYYEIVFNGGHLYRNYCYSFNHGKTYDSFEVRNRIVLYKLCLNRLNYITKYVDDVEYDPEITIQKEDENEEDATAYCSYKYKENDDY